MMKITISLTLAALIFTTGFAQPGALPLVTWQGNHSLPFIFFISGDGGMNKYSTALCETIHSAGYEVTAINAKIYFWEKKTPMQASGDMAPYLSQIMRGRKNQRWIAIGYSFGADVLPFIVNNMPEGIKSKLENVILLSPTRSTDFEIHLIDMLGINRERSQSVVEEVNKLNGLKTMIIFGSEEAGFPVHQVKLTNYTCENLPGGHHFRGEMEEVAQLMLKYLK